MRPKIRVTFIDQRGDHAGGAEESLALLLRNLSPDIEARVLLFSDGAFARRLRAERIPVTFIRLPSTVSAATRERQTFPAAIMSSIAIFRIMLALRRNAPDIVYTNTVKAHLLGGVAARLLGIRTIAHHRDLLGGRSRALVKATSSAIGGERIAVSNAVASWYALKRTHVVDQPVDLIAFREFAIEQADARARLGLPSAGRIVEIVGRINRWKGHDRFLRIAAAVSKCAPDVNFAVVGSPIFRDSDFQDELRRLAVDLGINDRVFFVPWVDDVRLVFGAIDLNCNCSTREPFGRTIMEAGAMGIPTVCFADGGAQEAMEPGQSGIAVQAGDEIAFANAVVAYLNDREQRVRDGDNARRFVERFDARRHGERVTAIIRSTASKPPVTSTPRALGRRSAKS